LLELGGEFFDADKVSGLTGGMAGDVDNGAALSPGVVARVLLGGGARSRPRPFCEE
jgi:hypothetical protein